MQNHDQENNSQTFEFVDATQLNEEEILKPKYTNGHSYKNSTRHAFSQIIMRYSSRQRG